MTNSFELKVYKFQPIIKLNVWSINTESFLRRKRVFLPRPLPFFDLCRLKSFAISGFFRKRLCYHETNGGKSPIKLYS